MSTISITFIGSGTVTVAGVDVSGNNEVKEVVINDGETITANDIGTSAFTKWSSGVLDKYTPSFTFTSAGPISFTVNFAEASVVTRRKYWPSQTELTDDSKPCRCGCFKVATNYASASERARAIRFAAAGCGCCSARID